VVFSGNEISLGLMLARGYSGTGRGQRAGAAKNRCGEQMRCCQMLIAGRAAAVDWRAWWREESHFTPAGRDFGPGAVLLTALFTLSVICVLCGALFSTGSDCTRQRRTGETAARGRGSVYLLETLGPGPGRHQLHAHFSRAGQLRCRWRFLVACSIWMGAGFAPKAGCSDGAVRPLMLFCRFGGLPLSPLETRSLDRCGRVSKWCAVRNSATATWWWVKNGRTQTLYENGLPVLQCPRRGRGGGGGH